jgi:hypothetical protein
VLSRFQPGERELHDRVISLAADAVELALREGPEAAANHYNGADLRELPGGANSG